MRFETFHHISRNGEQLKTCELFWNGPFNIFRPWLKLQKAKLWLRGVDYSQETENVGYFCRGQGSPGQLQSEGHFTL